MGKTYVNSGEGYYHLVVDPSRGTLGIPEEIEEQRKREFEEKRILEDAEESVIVSKAERLLEEYPYTSDPAYQREFLAILGFKRPKIIGGKAFLEEAKDRNVYRMYNRVIIQIGEIIRNPKKNTSLIKRILSVKFQ